MNPIKPTVKTEIAPVLMIILSFVVSFYFYAHFPAKVATHWGFSGEPNGYSGAAFAAFFLPVLNFGMYLLFLFIPLLDPKKDRYDEFRKPYHIFKSLIIGLLTIMFLLVGLNGLGYSVPIGTVTPVFVGLLFICIGVLMPKFKSNWTIGVRNMWTLSSEMVWNKTNQLSGKMFVFCGLILMAEPLMSDWLRLPAFIIGILSVILIPTVYSFILYNKEDKKKKLG